MKRATSLLAYDFPQYTRNLLLSPLKVPRVHHPLTTQYFQLSFFSSKSESSKEPNFVPTKKPSGAEEKFDEKHDELSEDVDDMDMQSQIQFVPGWVDSEGLPTWRHYTPRSFNDSQSHFKSATSESLRGHRAEALDAYRRYILSSTERKLNSPLRDLYYFLEWLPPHLWDTYYNHIRHHCGSNGGKNGEEGRAPAQAQLSLALPSIDPSPSPRRPSLEKERWYCVDARPSSSFTPKSARRTVQLFSYR